MDQCEKLQLEFLMFCSVPAALVFGDNVLLSGNISKKLDQFDLKKPIEVNCDIKGDLNVEGDPKIVVQAIIKNNELTIGYDTKIVS